MKYEIRKVDEEKGLVQITTTDERWYQKSEDDFKPSSTWVASFYPKGIEYMKWLASKGWDEAEEIKTSAGSRGSKVHHAIEYVIKGNELTIDQLVPNNAGLDEELTPEEYYAVMTFVEWYRDTKIEKIIAIEVSGVNDMFGGTIDLICVIGGEIWIIDFKTSASIWPSHRLQVSSYRHLLPHIPETKDIDITKVKLGVLQVGYMRNKTKHYKLTEIEDQYDLFKHAYAIWENEVSMKQPPQRTYPLSIKL